MEAKYKNRFIQIMVHEDTYDELVKRGDLKSSFNSVIAELLTKAKAEEAQEVK